MSNVLKSECKYYISTGMKGVMYTLRYKMFESYSRGDGTFQDRIIDCYLCTLSKNPDVALEKAKEYLADLGIDYTKYNLNTNFELNERAESSLGQAQKRRDEVAAKVMVSGKHEGVHVSDLDESYLKWCYLNTKKGINFEIIKEYVEENGFLEGWLSMGTMVAYKKLRAIQERVIHNVKNSIMEFYGQPKEYKIINKTGGYNQKTVDFYKQYSMNNSVMDYVDFPDSTTDETQCDFEFDLLALIKASMFNLNDTRFINSVVANYWRMKPRGRVNEFKIVDFDFETIQKEINENLVYQDHVMNLNFEK